MKKRIYDYIKENRVVSIQDVSKNLNLPDIFVLKTIQELRRKMFLRMCTPVPLSIDTQTSCFYTTTSKLYHKDI